MESDEETGGPEGDQNESSKKRDQDQTIPAFTDEEEELDLTILGLSAEDHTDLNLYDTEEEDGEHHSGHEEVEYGEQDGDDDEEEEDNDDEEEEDNDDEEEEEEGSEHDDSEEDISDVEVRDKLARMPKEDTIDYLEDDEEFLPSHKSSIYNLETETVEPYDETVDTSGYPSADFPDYSTVSMDVIQLSEKLMGIDEPDLLAYDELDIAAVDLPSAYAIRDHIESPQCPKPFLGGFLRKSTGVEYHNASSQAALRAPSTSDADGSGDGGSGGQRSRETQTHEMYHLLMQTMNDTSTQMTGIGVYMPNVTDRVIRPGKYETAEEREMRQLQQVITIQKYYRRWLAKVTIERMLERKRCLDDMLSANSKKAEEEKRMRLQRNFERRMHPRTTEDFDLLFTYLEKWRRKELERINSTMEKHHRKAALCDLMDRQAQLIHCIGMRRLEIAEPLHFALVNSFLNKVSAPVKQVRGDREILIEDDSIVQAQEFREVFLSLNLQNLTSEERMDLLITVKSMLQLHPCSISAELDQLIDRERDLLLRGFAGRALEGLRKRISHLFFQYIKLPMVNPAAKRFAKVPSDPMVLRGNMTTCSSCHRYLTPNDFLLAANLRKVGKCQECTRIDNRARKRKDFSIYKLMLKNIRRAEDFQNGNSKIVYLMQEKDFRYLISYIWHGRSVISAHDDLFDLEFVRWDRCEEWSPWNCILLTKDEARIHGKFRNLEKAYRKDFLHEIHCRHLVAKKYFHRLLIMARHMPDTSSEESTTVRNIARKYLTTTACSF